MSDSDGVHGSDCRCSASTGDFSTVSRRRFLTGAAALGGFGAGGLGLSLPGLAQAKPHRIDVHHHISPPTWLDAVKKAKLDNPPMANWSVQKSLEDMDKAGIATALTSPTTPQIEFLDKEQAAAICRSSNDYGKKLAADHPGRFGVFAMLPLPHVDETLREIAYAFDTLKVDGVGLMTSYGKKWLGDASFAPVWDELNRRKAVAYTHPTTNACCVNLVPGVPVTVVEFGADTTRTIASLILSGTSQKYGDISWIFSHGGGALTAFAERFQVQLVTTPPYKEKFTRASMDVELKRFYYDTAQISRTITLGALAKLIPVSQIVYGTDYPYRSGIDHTQGVSATFSGADLAAIDRDNVVRLIPRLKG
jgi:predicted TIM-barrel fold metal-dependent hydrolase